MKPLNFLAALTSFSLLCVSAYAQENNVSREFVTKILLGSDRYTGSSKLQTEAQRWITSPVVSVFDANPEQTAMTSQSVEHLNNVLAGTLVKMPSVTTGDEKATLQVYFLPMKDFAAFAKQHSLVYDTPPPGQDNLSFCWTIKNGDNAIEKAVVLIDSGMSGDRLHHYVLNGIASALGVERSHTVFKDSVFYKYAMFVSPATKAGTAPGTATELSSADKQLLRFLYLHLSPGATKPDIAKAYQTYWAS